MCHHKAPHRNWLPDEKHKNMYDGVEIPLPDTINDDYSNRSQAAVEAKMRITRDMFYSDLKLVPPEGGNPNDLVPHPENVEGFFLIPEETGEKVFFKDQADLLNFKYQRYIKDYLRSVASIDDNVGRLLKFLEEEGILDDTVVMYTSDQGFFLGDHGWYDKRFMYEESLRIPFMVRYPKEIAPGTVIDEITTNVDMPASFADWAGIEKPDYFQGRSFRPLARGETPGDWPKSMYYRYWMHLSHHYVSAHYGIRTKRYKLIYYYGEALRQPNTIDESKPSEWELFDLLEDPKELKNVYDDPKYADTVRELKRELRRLQDELGDEPAE